MSTSDGDLQSNVTADVQPALTGLAKLKAAYAAIGLEIKKINGYSQDFQNHINKNTKKTVGQTGNILGKLDGGLGGGFKSIFGDIGEASTFGRLAVVAGLASAGIKVFSDKVSILEEKALAGAASLERMNKALEAADTATKSRIDKGLAQADTHRALLAVGGEEAVAQADRVGREGLATPEEAARGVLSIYGKRGGNPKIARQSVDLARGAASRGVPFGAAADEAAGIPGEVNGSQAQMIIARIYQKHFNRMGPISTKTTDNAMMALSGDALERQARFGNSKATDLAVSDRDKAAAMGGALIAERTNEGMNPVTTAQLQAYKENTIEVQALKDELKSMAKVFNGMNGLAQKTDMLLTGIYGLFGKKTLSKDMIDKSLEIHRKQNAFADGVFGEHRSSIYRPKEHP